MLFDSIKTLAAIAIIVLWASVLSASYRGSDWLGSYNLGSDHSQQQEAHFVSPQQAHYNLDVTSAIAVATGPGDTPVQQTRRVSETAPLWLVCLGLALIVIGGLRRHK
jgi:hypothetical protein